MLEDVIGVTIATEDVVPIVLDPELIYPGWESYKETAEKHLNVYNAHIRVSCSTFMVLYLLLVMIFVTLYICKRINNRRFYARAVKMYTNMLVQLYFKISKQSTLIFIIALQFKKVMNFSNLTSRCIFFTGVA